MPDWYVSFPPPGPAAQRLADYVRPPEPRPPKVPAPELSPQWRARAEPPGGQAHGPASPAAMELAIRQQAEAFELEIKEMTDHAEREIGKLINREI
jgi:hypothetical protein